MGLKEGAVRGGVRNVSTGIGIPDSAIYLQDDWGDNKLTNRDESGTTTYNGVGGVYRPEWTIDNGSPSAANQRLELTDGDQLRAGLNLDFSSKITWSLTNWLPQTTGSGADLSYITLLSNSTSFSGSGGYYSGYFVGFARADNTNQSLYLFEIDGSGNTNLFIDGSSLNYSNGDEIRVERAASGDWTLFVGGTASPTVNDTTHTTVSHLGFSARTSRGGLTHTVDEIKVF